jgi:hypothetical protein
LTSELAPSVVSEIQRRALRLDTASAVVMLIGIAILLVYSIRLGPLVGPGVETSFGYALALMFIMAAALTHVVDRMYRVWPFGRRVRTAVPSPLTDAQAAAFVRIVIVLATAAALGYVLWGLIAT